MPRLHVPLPLSSGRQLRLPAGAARHAQVLRLQPGDGVTLFNGEGGQWAATILHMGRAEVQVQVGDHQAGVPEAPAVVLAVGMPANERMDWLIEKATELGVHAVVPLSCERGVLRLHGERAQRKVAHWQAVAVSASEQSGRCSVPVVEAVQGLASWLAGLGPRAPDGPARWMLNLQGSPGWASLRPTAPALFLSGPEGGLTAGEQQAARAAGFRDVCLGPRILRAETAPLAALSAAVLPLAG